MVNRSAYTYWLKVPPYIHRLCRFSSWPRVCIKFWLLLEGFDYNSKTCVVVHGPPQVDLDANGAIVARHSSMAQGPRLKMEDMRSPNAQNST